MGECVSVRAFPLRVSLSTLALNLQVQQRTDLIAKRTTGKLKHGYDCMVDDLKAPTATRVSEWGDLGE